MLERGRIWGEIFIVVDVAVGSRAGAVVMWLMVVLSQGRSSGGLGHSPPSEWGV